MYSCTSAIVLTFYILIYINFSILKPSGQEGCQAWPARLTLCYLGTFMPFLFSQTCEQKCVELHFFLMLNGFLSSSSIVHVVGLLQQSHFPYDILKLLGWQHVIGRGTAPMIWSWVSWLCAAPNHSENAVWGRKGTKMPFNVQKVWVVAINLTK